MKILKCKYCGFEFQSDGTRASNGKFAVHVRQCNKNPNRQKIINAYKQSGKKSLIGKRNHKQKLSQEKTRSLRTFICKVCGNNYQLNLTDNEYKYAIDHPGTDRIRQTCSVECAHSRKNLKTSNSKRKQSLKKFWKTNINRLRKCKQCGKPLILSKNASRTYCSNECKKQWHNLNYSQIYLKCQEAGKKSADIKNKRSKNEIYFYQLCKKIFQSVEHNKPIFNGWDADILIFDKKIAILWNGKWHYEKVFENQKSSLKQIQNRDKIKEKEILAAGWKLYIIKDMGSYNPTFVEQEFDKFMASQFNGRTEES